MHTSTWGSIYTEKNFRLNLDPTDKNFHDCRHLFRFYNWAELTLHCGAFLVTDLIIFNEDTTAITVSVYLATAVAVADPTKNLEVREARLL